MTGPISNLNQNAYSAVQSLNGQRLDVNNANRLKQAIMADNVVDAEEAQLVESILGGESNIEVSASENADFEPMIVNFGEVSQDSRSVLDDVIAFSELQNEGFIEGNESGRNYNPEQLANASASQIGNMIDALADNPNENQAPLFFLKMAGATLNNPEEANKFIQNNILNDSNQAAKDMAILNRFIDRKPEMSELQEARQNIQNAQQAAVADQPAQRLESLAQQGPEAAMEYVDTLSSDEALQLLQDMEILNFTGSGQGVGVDIRNFRYNKNRGDHIPQEVFQRLSERLEITSGAMRSLAYQVRHTGA